MRIDRSSARIAFLGLGKMGLPMASRLVAAGWRVVGFDFAVGGPTPRSLPERVSR